MNLKAIYNRYGNLIRPVILAKNRLFSLRCKNRGTGNEIIGLDRCRMKRTRISVSGSNNRIEIGDMSTLYGVSINIHGSGNRLILGSRDYLVDCAFCLEDDGNTICLGEHTYVYGGTELSAIEGTSLKVGEDCLFSADIMIRTGDSHSILRGGERINPSGDITIGNHVWLAKDVKVLKNAVIPENCVAGTGAVITAKTAAAPGSILAGSPAKVVKSDINWARER